MTVNTKKTLEQFIEEAKVIHGNRYSYESSVYQSRKSNITVICPLHGQFRVVAKEHLKGRGCVKCKKENEFKEKSRLLHNNFYDYSLVRYEHCHKKVTIICPIHGEFEQTPTNHLRGNRCVECGYDSMKDKLRHSPTDVNDKLSELYGEQFSLNEDTFNGSKEKTSFLCKDHGVFEQTTDTLFRGKIGCSKCSLSKTSKKELELVNFLDDLREPFISNDYDTIFPYELDIVIPDKKLAIEFDGIYWHSTACKKDKKYHLKKTLLCKDKGIRLIHIYEDEWINKQEVLMEYLKRLIDKSDKEKVYARKCTVKSVPNEEAQHILNNNHIQGYASSSIKLGLYYMDTLVAYLGIKKLKNGTFDINRYATSCSVPGGFSKLLSHFKRSYDWNEIITYADRRYSEGDLYHKTGFELEKICPPSFDYVKHNQRYNRQQFMKHKLKDKLEFFDPKLTERENMELNGYYQIWNCGYLKFVMSK